MARYKILLGGAEASWLMRLSPDRAVRVNVRSLAGDIVLGSWPDT